MATENALMAAVLAEGETIVGNAACEPHVQDLCRFLVALGARIEGIGSNVLRDHGRRRSSAAASTGSGPDHIEVASFIGLAAVTGGELTIEDVEPDDLISILPAFRSSGSRSRWARRRVRVPPGQELRVVDDLGDQIPKIEDGPWPAFPADLTSIALAPRPRRTGTVLIFEKMFENRLFFVDKLVAMGARIILCDPHRASSPARRSSTASGWRAPTSAPDGDADRGALRRGRVERSATSARSTAATSGSTSACARSGARDRAGGAVSGARIAPGTGAANVATGLPVLDHLLAELARAARFDLALEVDPDDPEAEVDAAGTALGRALAPQLAAGRPRRGDGARRRGARDGRRRALRTGRSSPRTPTSRAPAGSAPTSPRGSSAASPTRRA